MNNQFICPIRIEIGRDIDSELKVATPMVASVLTIDKDGGLVVDSAKVQQYSIFTGPV